MALTYPHTLPFPESMPVYLGGPASRLVGSENSTASSTRTIRTPIKTANPVLNDQTWKEDIRKILTNTEDTRKDVKELKENAEKNFERITELEKENKNLRDRLQGAQDAILQLEERANINYLVLSGIGEDENETEERLTANVNNMIKKMQCNSHTNSKPLEGSVNRDKQLSTKTAYYDHVPSEFTSSLLKTDSVYRKNEVHHNGYL
ncbi:unnamed protein product [Orchesella dallaii]|uniref:Uncharacterized protein n=1 Tax=Orchesella dallaii TaxID=48710 RepID=A0ABP1RQ26_9HEXA